MSTEEKAKAYDEAIETATQWIKDGCTDKEKICLECVFPELRENEDEKIRKLLVWQVYRNIEDETNDLAGSVYDGIKGHDPDLEESIEDWKKCLAWLEKQKEQKPAEWSEEDIKKIRSEEYTKGFNDAAFGGKLKEWGEEDKNDNLDILFSAVDGLDSVPYSGGHLKLSDEKKKELKTFIKSLRPQPHWKPSEEQMYSLGSVVKGYDNCTIGSVGHNLKELYKDLKKL